MWPGLHAASLLGDLLSFPSGRCHRGQPAIGLYSAFSPAPCPDVGIPATVGGDLCLWPSLWDPSIRGAAGKKDRSNTLPAQLHTWAMWPPCPGLQRRAGPSSIPSCPGPRPGVPLHPDPHFLGGLRLTEVASTGQHPGRWCLEAEPIPPSVQPLTSDTGAVSSGQGVVPGGFSQLRGATGVDKWPASPPRPGVPGM